MGREQRQKGNRYERYIRMKLQEVYPDYNVVRGNQRFHPYQPDVVVPTYWVECTVGKNPRINAKIKQAIRDMNETPDPEQKGKIPLIISKQDRETDYATVPLNHFLWLIKMVGQPLEEVDQPQQRKANSIHDEG